MAKQYTFTKKEVGQRPRSKRLRECNVEFPSAHDQAQGTLDLSGKVDVGFFSMLFEAQDSEGNAISVNSPIGNINRLRVKCNLFSDFGVSALGYSPGGSSGGDMLTSPLAEINAAGLGIPSSAGLGIVWNGSQWTYGQVGGTDINAVWASLASEDNTKQIDISHLTNALAGYATQSWVSSQNKFGIIGSDYVEITLNGTTKNVLAAHQSLADYVKNIQLGTNGTVYSPTSGKITLPAYPTTLPASDVSAWAKAANKPSYGFSEIAGSVAASQLPTMYWADIAISNQSNNNTSPQFGNLRLRPGNANYGSYLRFGDGNYCYLYEDTDDHLLIYASKGVKITTGTGNRLMWGDNIVATLADIDGMATQTWVTDNMMKKARLDTTANIDTLYDAGSYRFGATAEGTWPVASNYGQVLVVRGADDTVAQMFFPYVESKAYLRTGNPQNANNGYWRAWREIAFTDGNIASATRLASNDTKTLFGNTYWNSGQPQNVGTSWSNTANLSYVNNITMKSGLNGVTYIEMNNNQDGYATGFGGYIDFHYNGSSSDYTSRIIEDQNGRLNFNLTAFIYKSNKPGKADDFPGGALNETTDWGGYSFRNVFTNNSLFENTLFLRADLYMRTNTGIRIKNYAGADVMAFSLESNSSSNNIVVGAGAHTIAGVSTVIRGNTVNFQTANGAGSTLVGHYDNTGNYYLDVIGKAIYMKDANGTARNVLQVDKDYTLLAIGYGMISADYRTNIYGGGGDDKGIRFFHGTALAASVEGGDHSLVAFYHIKLTTNNQSLYTRNTSGTPIDTVRLTSNNILYFGYGCSTNNHETRIYGGATAGIGFFCGSTEVARVHKDAARQGIRIGDGLLSWDSTNNAFKVSKIDSGGNEVAANLYALGGVSALGFTAPQSSLDAFHIDYLTSTSVTAQTMHASRFYLNSSIYLYLDGSSLKITNGTTTKTITTL